jgi:hypothetical protein
MPGCDLADNAKATGSLSGILCTHCITIHSRIGKGWDILRSDDRCGDHGSKGLVERD